MTTIVLNTQTGAVTEYDWAFQSLAPQYAGGDALLALGGDDDAGAPISAEIRSGKPGGSVVQRMENVYLALRPAGGGTLIVQGRTQDWEYPVVARASSGVSRATPGKGIKESYLGFGYRNAGGADFQLDRIDAEVVASNTRRK